MAARIQLNQLSMDVLLGWPKDERSAKQTVFVDIILHFHALPTGCQTDELADTICYRSLIEKLIAHTQAKEYRLLEYLGHDIYQFLKSLLNDSLAIAVTITKFPSIDALTQGVSFQCGDL